MFTKMIAAVAALTMSLSVYAHCGKCEASKEGSKKHAHEHKGHKALVGTLGSKTEGETTTYTLTLDNKTVLVLPVGKVTADDYKAHVGKKVKVKAVVEKGKDGAHVVKEVHKIGLLKDCPDDCKKDCCKKDGKKEGSKKHEVSKK